MSLKETSKFDFEKTIYFSLKRIEALNKKHAFTVKKSKAGLLGCFAILRKTKKKYFVCQILKDEFIKQFGTDQLEETGVLDEIVLANEYYSYTIPSNTSQSAQLRGIRPQLVNIQVSELKSGEEKDYENVFFRLVIHTPFDPDLTLIQPKSLFINERIIGAGLIEIKLGGLEYHLFKHRNSDKDENYLIIDSVSPVSLPLFEAHSNAVVTAYGLISGNLFLDEYYYLTAKDSTFERTENIYYKKLGESAITNYKLFNPSEFRDYLKAVQQEHLIEKYGIRMKSQAFSDLCERIAAEPIYERCCKLVIEANLTKQVLLRGGILSIAIETLTSLIYEKNTSKINPIKDNGLVEKIQEKFRLVLKDYDAFIDEYGLSVLNSKISDLNKPTNSKKLSAPFEQYGIKLSKEDLAFLDQRNAFLHGREPNSKITDLSPEKVQHYMVSRLQSMLIQLMLKYVGYSGHVINYPGQIRYYDNKQSKIKEHLYLCI